MKIKSTLLKKFLSFSMGSWITLVLSIITTPILTRILTPEDYGSLSLFLLSINLVVVVSLFGLDQSYMRFYYEASNYQRSLMLGIGVIFSLLTSIILIFLIYIFKPYSLKMLIGTSDIYLFFLFCIILLLSVITRFNYVLLRMDQKAKLYSTLQVIQKLVDFLAFLSIYFILTTELNNLYIAIYSYALSIFILFLAGLFFNLVHYKELLNFKLDKTTFIKDLKILLLFGIPLSVTILITWVFQYIDRLMLNHYTTLIEVGIYAAAFKIIAIINIIQISFSTFWTPISNQRFNNNKNDKIFFEKMFNRVLYVLVTIGVLILLFKDVLAYFFGEEYREAVNLVPYLILIPIMYTLSEITVVGINFEKKTKYHIYISLIVCLINIVGNLLLIPKYGAQGAALSTGVTYIIYFLLRTFIGMKFYRFNAFSLKNILVLTSFIAFCFIV